MMERFQYDNRIAKNFMFVTLLWGVVGTLVGLTAAMQLVLPSWNFAEWGSFGRLRPLHTNAMVFAFVGNAIFAGVYYSLQRLLKTRMYSDLLSAIHFWGWQLIIVAAAITLPLGMTTGKEYAELEWPIDIAITLVWVVFGINMFGTILGFFANVDNFAFANFYSRFEFLSIDSVYGIYFFVGFFPRFKAAFKMTH